MTSTARPAFYALAPGGWRDYVTLLHLPYTLWHLSYVAVGASLAPDWRPGRLLLTVAAFFLAVGVGAHALDELNGRPLGTRIPAKTLVALAAASLAGGCALGLYGALAWSLWLLAFIVAGVFLVCAYNLEWLGGRFHSDLWFGLAWGGFPVLTAYFAAAEELRGEAALAAVFATLLSLAQRRLSTPVRTLRRRVTAVSGSVDYADGERRQLTREQLIEPAESALRAMTIAVVALALALVLLRAW